MKITIDTKEDSHEEIRRVIKMLSSLVGEKEVMSNQGDLFSSESSGAGANTEVFSMFGSSGSGSETKSEEAERKKKEDKVDIDLDIPELEEYHD